MKGRSSWTAKLQECKKQQTSLVLTDSNAAKILFLLHLISDVLSFIFSYRRLTLCGRECNLQQFSGPELSLFEEKCSPPLPPCWKSLRKYFDLCGWLTCLPTSLIWGLEQSLCPRRQGSVSSCTDWCWFLWGRVRVCIMEKTAVRRKPPEAKGGGELSHSH